MTGLRKEGFIGTDENRSDSDDIHANSDEIPLNSDDISRPNPRRYFCHLSPPPSFLLTSVSGPVRVIYGNLYKSRFGHF